MTSEKAEGKVKKVQTGSSAGTRAWPEPSPRSPSARQKYHRHTGLTGCSTLWMHSGDCLEFLLLLKADMLEGQMEFNHNCSAALLSSLSREDPRSRFRTDGHIFNSDHRSVDRKSPAG